MAITPDGMVILVRDENIVDNSIASMLDGVMVAYLEAAQTMHREERELLKLNLAIGLEVLLDMTDDCLVNRALPLQ